MIYCKLEIVCLCKIAYFQVV